MTLTAEEIQRLQELLDLLASGLVGEERDNAFLEAFGILDLYEETDETLSWFNRFAPYFSPEDDSDEMTGDEEDPAELGDGPAPIPKEEEDPGDPEDPEVPIPKLTDHQIDIPEEPEKIRVITQVWDDASGGFVEKDLGELTLVPTGCEEPTMFSPYENTVSFRSPLPRDKERDANLYAMYQSNGWASRAWIRAQLDEDFADDLELDREIADDIPVILAIQGKPDMSGGAAGVGQTEGMGSNNGAPLPPGPGPGRGNKNVPGDGAAKAQGGSSPI